jgi:hypothetical protein
MALLAAPFFGAIFFRGLNANTKATLLVAVIAGTFLCLCFVSLSLCLCCVISVSLCALWVVYLLCQSGLTSSPLLPYLCLPCQ